MDEFLQCNVCMGRPWKFCRVHDELAAARRKIRRLRAALKLIHNAGGVSNIAENGQYTRDIAGKALERKPNG
jgi:DNA-binding phage protein